MNAELLTPADRQLRMNVRNFLLTATREQLVLELEVSNTRGDMKRARFVRELLDEHDWAQAEDAINQRRSLVEALVAAFAKAKEAGLEAASNTEDNGTCNLDSPAFRCKRVSDAAIQEAAERIGVEVCGFEWSRNQRWFWLGGTFLQGQGNLRARTAKAATDALREAAPEWMEVRHYCQMD